jgi:hypothetical protein
MKHDELKVKILGLYDGPVTEKERLWAENHLSSCADCSRAVEEYKSFASVLFALPTLSEADEDIFTNKVMLRIKSASAEAAQSVLDITVRWFIPLLGSTAVAAWVFFSLLPSTPELSAAINGSSFFSSDAHEISSNAWTPAPTTKSNEEIVVSWIKE